MNSARIVHLAEPAAPVPEVVALLRDLLARAESGEVIGIAVGVACSRRCDGTGYAIGDGDIATLVLALERCKQRLLAHAGPA